VSIDLRASTVVAWRDGLAAQWGGDPLAEDPQKLAALAEFCRFCGKSPDELVEFCFLRRRGSGERFLSVQRRRAVAGWLADFQQRGLEGSQPGRVADVLSFLIHNGVMMHTGMISVSARP
jgi:hypothetical protein